jgi:hypothetical protein
MSKANTTPKASETASPWSFVSDKKSDGLVKDTVGVAAPIKVVDPIKWSSEEYIAHSKSFQWYVVLFFVIVVFAGIIYLLTKDKITTGIILFVGIIFGVYSGRKPSELEYSLDDARINIGQKFYDLASFRSFSIVDDEGSKSLLFVPLRRFSPMLTVYYPANKEDRILEVLNNRLPLDNRGHDVLERFLRKINY